MPDNPDVPTLLDKAGAAARAQRKLRDAMAAVAAEISQAPAPVPPAGKPAQ